MSRPLRVFLCHASQDKPAVRELYKRLKAEGWIDPWLDEEKLSFGQHWTTAIEDALDDADIVLLFLSKNSVQKEGFVQRELNYAWELSLEKPRNVIFLIPFRLDDCEIPRYLASRQWGDYFGDKKDGTYKILLRSLKQRHKQKLELEAEEADRETAEKLVREKEEKEAADKLAREQAAREKRDREAREKLAREQAAQGGSANIAPKNIARRQTSVPPRQPERTPTILSTFSEKPWVWFVGIFVALLFFWGISALINRDPAAPVSEQSTPITPTRTPPPIMPTPTLGIGSTMISEKDGMVLVFVPAGEFTMGSDSGQSDEKPVHQVYLDDFWIDQTEVTNAMYAQCVADGDCSQPSSVKSYTHDSYYGNSEFDDFPVIYVNWNQAQAYCAWAGRSLPSEAQWEKAARGTDGRTYPWGEDSPNSNLLNYNRNVGDTTKVGYYPNGASVYGAYDMAGNVWEWVNDWYSETYYQSSPASNPTGPASGQYRVLRGGSWDFNEFYVRSALRLGFDPAGTNYNVGFRCSLSR